MEDKFEVVNVGDKADITHIISENDVDRYADITGDTNPLHMSEEYASTTSFKKRVVHGMLTASFISNIIGTKLPGTGALWYELNIRFIAPVRIGDEITVHAEVIRKSRALRVVSLSIHVELKNSQRVIEGQAKIKILEQKKKGEAIMNSGAVIITGASRGIGAATARLLASTGIPVVVNYLQSEDKARALVNSLAQDGHQAIAVAGDVCSSQDMIGLVEAAISKFGSLRGIVNNASAYPQSKAFDDLSWSNFQEQIDVQIKGAFHLCQAAMPWFLKQGGGSIVNIGSIFSDGIPPSFLMPYVVSKAALNAFTKSLAAEYGPKNIRVNSVAPGMTDTDFIADVPEKTRMLNKMQAPLRRLAEPEDTAGAVAYLLSHQSKFVTGETIRVCGGIVMC